jgi:hypothetical protein
MGKVCQGQEEIYKAANIAPMLSCIITREVTIFDLSVRRATIKEHLHIFTLRDCRRR